ncbi:MAG: ABC transporter permease [Spirochaetia bacterium]|nr:ABC transporter permease [Spirochaetia bacterium]MBQ3712945.1 ABC transporter permease [Spirochaetia bacterium]MBQ6673103.1 ABC transporter permease [Spirochaetia bacterium]MBR0317909.1 ABC transporter permease [Spirochaetia bacterium]
MIRSLPNSKLYTVAFNTFIVAYFVFLFAPLLITCILAFNNSMIPTLPWKGFTLDWFFGTGKKTGFFNDPLYLRAFGVSFKLAIAVSLMSTAMGTCAAFLFEQENFPLKNVMYLLMIAPIVIPGVILGISILSFTTTVADFFKDNFGIRLDFMRPSFWLVAFGQFSFISTYVCMVVSARLKKFDRTLEDAAYNLGANRFQVIWYITLKYLRPSIIGGLALSFLLSFENFNTTLFLVGAEFPLPVALFNRVRDGSTPVINAISFILIFATSICAMVNLIFSRKKKED